MNTKFAFPLLFCLLLSSFIKAQCPTQNLTITSQEVLDSFKIKYPLCTDLDVDLTLRYNSIVSLSPLNELKSMKKLNIFECHSLYIADINEELQISSLAIAECDIMESARIINNVAPNGNLYLIDLPKLSVNEPYILETLNDLEILELRIESLSKFPSLTSINGKLSIQNNPKLIDISLLNDIQFDDVNIINNPLLESCAIESICNLIKEDLESVNINNNGPECTYLNQIITTCFPDTIICYTNELKLENQQDLDYLSSFSDQCIDSISVVSISSSIANDITDLTNLIRFKNLELLGIANTEQLTSLAGLDSLHSVYYLGIYNNSKLASLEGLGNLKNISGLLEIQSNNSLTKISSEDLMLEELGYLRIDWTPIDDLSAISNIDSLKGLRLDRTELINLDWAENMHLSGNVFIKNNDNLENITLNNLSHSLGNCEIIGNDKLTSIDGLKFKDTVQTIIFQENPNISVIQNIQGPKFCSSFSMYFTELTNLLPWVGFEYASQIDISSNQQLESIEFLSSFTEINKLTISYNANLTSLGSIPTNIQTINNLVLLRNEVLQDISVLDNDGRINIIKIKDNPLLETCDILPICKEYKSIYPDIQLEGNSGNCNLVDLNFDCEWGHNAYGDVIAKSQDDIDSIISLFPLMDSVYGNLVFDFSLNLEVADFSFFDNIAFVRDELEIRYPRQDNVFEMFEGVSVGGLVLVSLNTSTLDILDFADTLSQFRLSSIDGLNDFKGMENVTRINGKIDIVETSIISTDGLDNLKTISAIQLIQCPLLSNINSFSDVEWIRDLRLSNLNQLSDFDLFNDMIIPLKLQFNELPHLSNFPTFIQIPTVDMFSISRCHSLTNLEMDSLVNVNDRLSIFGNQNLERASFANVVQAKNLSFVANDIITDIQMPNINSVAFKFNLLSNDSLSHIDDINHTMLAHTMAIERNPNLEDCNIELICNNYQAGSNLSVEDNLGCQTLEEIIDICAVSTSEQEGQFPFKVFPNPVSNILNLEGKFNPKSFEMYNSIGQKMEFILSSNQIDMRSFSNGLYYLKVSFENDSRIVKIIKE